MSVYYTYIYFDPRDNLPFYVGKGKNRRVYQSKNKQVQGRIRILKERNLEPIIDIIDATSEFAAYWLEKAFIKAFGRKDLGTGTLLNFTDGGDGGTVSLALMDRMINENPMKPGMVNSGSFINGHTYDMSTKHKEHIRKAKIGDRNPNFGNKQASAHLNSTKASCVNCRIVTTIGNIFRWHGDKCRYI